MLIMDFAKYVMSTLVYYRTPNPRPIPQMDASYVDGDPIGNTSEQTSYRHQARLLNFCCTCPQCLLLHIQARS